MPRRRRKEELLLQRRGRREELLRDAASHGPYLWSDIDVENALLWFRQTPTTTSSSSSSSSSSCGKDGDDNTIADDDSGEADEDGEHGKDDENGRGKMLEEGCEFLRRLLHAPGGASCYARPPTLGEDDDGGGRRRRKRRRRDDIGGGQMALEAKEEEKKRKDKTTKKRRGRSCRGGSSVLEALEDDDDVVDKGREKDDDDIMDDNDDVRGGKGSDPPLRSILLGYYTLFVLASATSPSRPLGNDTENCAEGNIDVGGSMPSSPGRAIETSTAFQHNPNASSLGGNVASSRLLSDLISIVSARRGRAHDVRRAYARAVDREVRTGGGEGGGGGGGGGDATMDGTFLFEEYMTRPSTCARLAYSSSLYDRIVHLWGDGTKGDGAVVDASPQSTASLALRGFLRKLLSFAVTDAKIREVTLLVLLEPYKRSSRACRRLDDIERRRRGHRGHRCEEKEATADKSELTSRWSEMSENEVDLPQVAARAPSLHDGKGSPQPVPSSASPRRDYITAKEAQRECAYPPVSTLAHLILRKISGGGRRAAATADVDETAGAAWWTLPSPLLCAVSHSYPPIALEYVRYWIRMATIGHAELYDIPLALNRSDDGVSNGRDIGSGFCNTNAYKDEEDGELFKRAIRRIMQFRSTSDNLDLLCRHELQSIERARLESLAEEVDEDKDAAFKTSLAWRAIHRALE